MNLSSILHPEQTLMAYREPSNKHDRNAIVLKTSNATKVGYIPRTENLQYALHMDRGGKIEVRIISIDVKDPWKGVKIRIRSLH